MEIGAGTTKYVYRTSVADKNAQVVLPNPETIASSTNLFLKVDNENGNNPFLATTPPLDRENENQNQEPENKFIKLFYGLVYVLGGSVILVLLVNAYKYLTGKYKKPTVINPE